MVMVGCSGLKETKSRNYYLSHKEKLAELCASEYPGETKYIKGETIIKRDSFPIEVPYRVDCDSVVESNKVSGKPNVVNGVVYTKLIKELQTRIDTLQDSNKALEAKLQYRINDLESDNTLLIKEKTKLENDLKQAKKESSHKDWIIGGLLFALGISIIVIIKR